MMAFLFPIVIPTTYKINIIFMQFINRIKLQLSSSFIWFVAVPLSPFRFVAVFVAVLTYTIFVAIDQWLSPF